MQLLAEKNVAMTHLKCLQSMSGSIPQGSGTLALSSAEIGVVLWLPRLNVRSCDEQRRGAPVGTMPLKLIVTRDISEATQRELIEAWQGIGGLEPGRQNAPLCRSALLH